MTRHRMDIPNPLTLAALYAIQLDLDRAFRFAGVRAETRVAVPSTWHDGSVVVGAAPFAEELEVMPGPVMDRATFRETVPGFVLLRTVYDPGSFHEPPSSDVQTVSEHRTQAEAVEATVLELVRARLWESRMVADEQAFAEDEAAFDREDVREALQRLGVQAA
jgi:hypothetical protein